MMKKITLLVSSFFAVGAVLAQQSDNSVTVVPCSYFGISRPLSELMVQDQAQSTTDEPWFSPDREHRVAQEFQFTAADGPTYGNDPNTIQTKGGDRMQVAVLTNWAGQGSGQCPPDPSGEVGPNYYVQT